MDQSSPLRTLSLDPNKCPVPPPPRYPGPPPGAGPAPLIRLRQKPKPARPYSCDVHMAGSNGGGAVVADRSPRGGPIAPRLYERRVQTNGSLAAQSGAARQALQQRNTYVNMSTNDLDSLTAMTRSASEHELQSQASPLSYGVVVSKPVRSTVSMPLQEDASLPYGMSNFSLNIYKSM